MLNIVILVGIGGALGAILRELLMLGVGIVKDGFPLDIFVANVTASFLLGLAFSAHARKVLSDNVYVLVGTGVMGGLSTFSSFVFAAVQLFERSNTDALVSAVYVLLSVVVGFGAVLLGLWLGGGATRTNST